MNNLLKNKKRGNAWAGILILLTFILTLGLAVMSDSLSTTLQTRKLAQIHVAQALCDAGVERAIWELNTSRSLSEMNFTLPTGYVEISVVGGSPSLGWVEIQATSYVPNEESPKTTRTVRAKIKNEPNESAIGFDKAVQVGGLGLEVKNGAIINGSVYSGGKVKCDNNGVINGDVYVHDNSTGFFTNSIVDGCNNGIKDAFSYDILNTTVSGTGYYVGSKIGSTGVFEEIGETDLPGYEELPIPEAEIQRFKSWAAKDGEPNEGSIIVRNKDVKIIGPKVINGDLKVETGGTLILTGALQVIGDINIDSGSDVILHESFERNGSILIASKDSNGDKGKIDIQQNVAIRGTGFEEEQCEEEGNCTTRKPSYILIIAESDSDNEDSPAIWAGNNSGSVIYYAPYGIIKLRPNTAIHAITGAGLIMDNNSSLDFVDGLELGNFSGGPGRTWRLIEWQVLY
ncbi:hypothetical protein K0A96_00380 [Patescibacteria group bacterium]|nr:hypothetical protein [Patescibacteria group bacterium]